MSKPIIKANLKNSDKINLVYNGRQVEMTVGEFFQALPSGNIVISNTPGPNTSGIYSGSGYLPAHVTVNGLSGYDLYFTAIADFKILANKFLLEHGTLNFTSGSYEGQIAQSTLTSNKVYTLPNTTGQFALEPVGTKVYKALISQNAPVASQTSGTVYLGSIWTIETFASGDDFSNWELISGTANTSGAVYRALTTAPTTWSNGSDLSYDGAPYIVSTNSDGDFTPFVNTLGEDLVFGYAGAGDYTITSSGIFLEDKLFLKPLSTFQGTFGEATIISRNTDTTLILQTSNDNGSTTEDDLFFYSPIEFYIYP